MATKSLNKCSSLRDLLRQPSVDVDFNETITCATSSSLEQKVSPTSVSAEFRTTGGPVHGAKLMLSKQSSMDDEVNSKRRPSIRGLFGASAKSKGGKDQDEASTGDTTVEAKRRPSLHGLFGSKESDDDASKEGGSVTKRRPSLRGLFGSKESDDDLSKDGESVTKRRPSLRGLLGLDKSQHDGDSDTSDVKKRRSSFRGLFRSSSNDTSEQYNDETGTVADETCTESGGCFDELQVTPHAYLMFLLENRGYNTTVIRSTETAFHNKPTPYQLASHGPAIVKVMEQKAEAELEAFLEIGISPNACDNRGETLVHMACRLGQHQLVKLFLKNDFILQVCDAQGRTPLHATCWGTRPSFQTFSLLMREDPSLVLFADKHGKCPLEYIRKDHCMFWLEYLDRVVDEFWPNSDEASAAMAECDYGRPFTRPLEDPEDALPLQIVEMLAQGKISRDEAILFMLEDGDDDDDSSSCTSFGEEDSEAEDSDDDSDDQDD